MANAEMRQRRRWPLVLGIGGLTVWVVALIAAVVVLAATAGPATFGGVHKWREELLQGSGSAKVALVPIVGEITAGGGGLLGGKALGSDDYVGMLRQALDDDDVKAVVLRIDSPGGAVVASDDVHRMVLRVRASKPVVVSMGDEAASGGYYIAAGANKIYANGATLTGSIGVIAIFVNLEGTAQKIGAKPVIIKSGPHKDIGSPFRSLTPQERGILQTLIDQAYGQFVDVVAEGRAMTTDEVRRLADGRVYSGIQAKDLRLIDALGNLDDAFLEAKRLAGLDRARLVEYHPPGIGFGDLLGAKLDIGAQIRSALEDSTRSVVGVPTKPGLEYLWLP